MKNKMFFTILAVVLGCAANANSIIDDFRNLNARYANQKAYSMDFEVRYMTGNESSQAIHRGRVLHTTDLHYTSLQGHVTLLNKDEFVAVNESAGIMVYNKIVKENAKPAEPMGDVSTQLDSLFAGREGLRCRYISSAKGTRKVYIEDHNNTYYSAYAITIDANNYRLLEFMYYVRPEVSAEVSRVVITYSNETARPKLNLPEYKISHYVTGSPDERRPTELYKQYEFTDQTKMKF